MPVVMTSSRTDLVRIEKYNLPMCFDLDGDALLLERLRLVKEIEGLKAQQKAFSAAKDFDAAKSMKAEVAEATKAYRAVCLLVPWYVANPPGDCPVRDLYEVGPELFPALVGAESKFEMGWVKFLSG